MSYVNGGATKFAKSFSIFYDLLFNSYEIVIAILFLIRTLSLQLNYWELMWKQYYTSEIYTVELLNNDHK